MPIYMVIYVWRTIRSYGIKEILRVVPTTFEEIDEVIKENSDLIYNQNMNPMPSFEYWVRHDESVLADAAK